MEVMKTLFVVVALLFVSVRAQSVSQSYYYGQTCSGTALSASLTIGTACVQTAAGCGSLPNVGSCKLSSTCSAYNSLKLYTDNACATEVPSSIGSSGIQSPISIYQSCAPLYGNLAGFGICNGNNLIFSTYPIVCRGSPTVEINTGCQAAFIFSAKVTSCSSTSVSSSLYVGPGCTGSPASVFTSPIGTCQSSDPATNKSVIVTACTSPAMTLAASWLLLFALCLISTTVLF